MNGAVSPNQFTRVPRPQDAKPAEKPLSEIPSQVFDIFNGLIRSHWNGRFACVYQDEIRAAAERTGVKMTETYWSIEPHYRQTGWRVEYNRPANYGNDDWFRAFYVFYHDSLTPEERQSCYQYGER